MKRCILVLVGAAFAALGIAILWLLDPEPGDEIIWITLGVLFVISGLVLLVRALIGDRGQVDKDFWKLLDGF